MRKSIRLSVLGVLACGMMANPPSATAEEYPTIAPTYEIFGGFSVVGIDDDDPRSSFGGDSLRAASNRLRSGTARAFEYEPDDSSLILGGKIEAFPLPQRFYLNADVQGDDDWFGEVRHSYKDLYQFRLLGRRFVHNLDNITLYDLGGPGANEVSRLDIGKEYGYTIDIDQFKVRLKTPNFPFHLYTEGELVKRDGNKQELFRGFSGASPARVSDSMDVDQSTKELTVGANSHLGWIEADISHSWQNFDSDVEEFYPYQAAGVRPAGSYVHNELPELMASKNTLKVHTTQTGQVFASATLSEIERQNEVNESIDEVEAKRRLAHGDLMWTPLGNLSFGTKYRHRENSSSGPDTIVSPYNGALINTPQGVEGDTDMYAAFVRYSPISKVTLRGQYSMERLERDETSAQQWFRAEGKDTDTIELGAAWRVRHDLKMNAKYTNKDVDVDRGDVLHIFNNDPEKIQQFTADATYFPTARTSVWVSALFKKDTADNLESLETFFAPFAPITVAGHRAKDYDALWQRYMASVSHACTERFSTTATYVYSATDTDRDLGIGFDVIDQDYSSTLAYHTISLSNSFQATDRLNLEGIIDYTLSTGDYSLDDPALDIGSPLSIDEIATTDIREFGVRLESEYQLDRGWKAGVVVRYVGIVDKSFDNPADGEMYGALLKMTKVFH